MYFQCTGLNIHVESHMVSKDGRNPKDGHPLEFMKLVNVLYGVTSLGRMLSRSPAFMDYKV